MPLIEYSACSMKTVPLIEYSAHSMKTVPLIEYSACSMKRVPLIEYAACSMKTVSLIEFHETHTVIYIYSQMCLVLFNDTWSQSRHQVSCITILFSVLANHKIRHQAPCKVNCQPGDCRQQLKSFLEVCVVMFRLKYPLFPFLRVYTE